ncbi:MarR family winged helix-turn-helix transcriptional regulator [Micromonospora sagamiensis]|uniref:MarR family transcriptional regulator n=1 Tax=Micromonospora sagamiensis TaxID=47875 RepID=A0A562WS70_9ACTN|nr:MarR family winged helix-turn-helix transcriptional regulator [Micromonospora sagamiensis]TWJ32264.1 hypothetical protein JD81_05839 [Micromonospora sagamiensis]BCL14674.1 hypothetical protein GCM10017556_24130 [Micromonospora sagamiensis]
MTDSTKNPSTLERVLTALAELGPATAASIGESIGIAYPTTTPKLRELESAGHAERVRTEQRTTLWQLTEPGRAAAASVADSSTTAPSAASGNDDARAADDSQKRAELRTESEPEPGTGTPAEGQAPVGLPAQQTGDPTAEAGQAGPTPAEATGPAERALAPQDEPGTEPMPERETEAAPRTDPGAPSSKVTHDQPSGEPRPDHGANELETDSTTEAERQTAALAEESGTGTPKRDGRRKPAQPRRRKGELRDEVLTLLRRHPDTAYKVGEICKLINQARDGAQVNKASAGAVANALDKLVIAGNVTRLDTKVATYQAV